MKRIQEYDAVKDPDDVIDYGRNWGDSLDGDKGWLHDGELIHLSTWEITSDKEPEPTLEIDGQGSGISSDQKITSVFLKGGTSGVAYKLTNTIITLDNNAANRKASKTGIIKCCEE